MPDAVPNVCRFLLLQKAKKNDASARKINNTSVEMIESRTNPESCPNGPRHTPRTLLVCNCRKTFLQKKKKTSFKINKTKQNKYVASSNTITQNKTDRFSFFLFCTSSAIYLYYLVYFESNALRVHRTQTVVVVRDSCCGASSHLNNKKRHKHAHTRLREKLAQF